MNRDTEKAATVDEVRAIIGPCDDDLAIKIMDLAATPAEVLEAHTWLMSDDYLHRRLHHSLRGRAADVFDILESELPEPDRS
ncbi:MAG TPA: hypothetical protein VN632_06725 [Stellaceae bacterium]|nr:hypothetical protein [Stellaceae bacterium]